MARGIDIYRYQTVTDPEAVADAGIEFAYVKGTDGGGRAIVTADRQVGQMVSVGISTGLYHYAQLSPSPEVQADVLVREVRRIPGADGLPPALDLEDPHTTATGGGFARRFLSRLAEHGFRDVTLYANTSMLNGINADAIVADLARAGITVHVWAAQYGPNDGTRHPLRYGGQWRIHQFTSVAGVPGISGRVDLNEAPSMGWAAGSEDAEVITNEDLNKIAEYVWRYKMQPLNPDDTPAGDPLAAEDMVIRTNQASWIAAGEDATSIVVDPAKLAAALIDAGFSGGATVGQIEDLISRTGLKVLPVTTTPEGGTQE